MVDGNESVPSMDRGIQPWQVDGVREPNQISLKEFNHPNRA